MGCGKNCAKWLLVTFNIFFWATGVALLAFGIYLSVDKSLNFLQGFVSPNDPMLQTAGYILCGVGAVILVIGFCGCCGALKENVCLLSIYAVCVAIIMCAEIAAGIYVGIKKDSVMNIVFKEANKTISENYGNETSTKQNGKRAVDGFQRLFNCCGVKSPDDWNPIRNWMTGQAYGPLIRPASCCLNKEADDVPAQYVTCMTEQKYATSGCLPQIISLLDTYFPAVIAVACTIGILELFGIIFAIILCKSDKD